MKRCISIGAWVLLGILGVAQSAAAEIFITPRHLIILRQGLDAVYGSYIFAVQNTGEEEAQLEALVMLPKETIDFQPQEGVGPDDVKLSDEGLLVDASFPSGVHIISIGFKVDSKYGTAQLSFTPTTEIPNLTVLAPKEGGISIESKALIPGETGNAPDPQYKPFVNRASLPAGELFQVRVSGLPEGRSRLWVVGGAVGSVLLILAALLTLKTRPRITAGEEAGSSVLVA